MAIEQLSEKSTPDTGERMEKRTRAFGDIVIYDVDRAGARQLFPPDTFQRFVDNQKELQCLVDSSSQRLP